MGDDNTRVAWPRTFPTQQIDHGMISETIESVQPRSRSMGNDSVAGGHRCDTTPLAPSLWVGGGPDQSMGWSIEDALFHELSLAMPCDAMIACRR